MRRREKNRGYRGNKVLLRLPTIVLSAAAQCYVNRAMMWPVQGEEESMGKRTVANETTCATVLTGRGVDSKAAETLTGCAVALGVCN